MYMKNKWFLSTCNLPKAYCHRESVPNTLARPITVDISTPNVIHSWLNVPHSPRSVIGAISDKYSGATPVFIPVNIEMTASY